MCVCVCAGAGTGEAPGYQPQPGHGIPSELSPGRPQPGKGEGLAGSAGTAPSGSPGRRVVSRAALPTLTPRRGRGGGELGLWGGSSAPNRETLAFPPAHAAGAGPEV